jgi:cell division protein ZapA
MSAKTSAEVVIDGKVYTLSGYEGEEYLQKVAAYINNKFAEFDALADYRHLPANMKGTLIQLNIADDYFKAKSQVEKLEHDMELKEKEIYDLKHDLISEQVKVETAESLAAELKSQNHQLLVEKAGLESELKKSESEKHELSLNKQRLEKTLEEQLLDGKSSKKGNDGKK